MKRKNNEEYKRSKNMQFTENMCDSGTRLHESECYTRIEELLRDLQEHASGEDASLERAVKGKRKRKKD